MVRFFGLTPLSHPVFVAAYDPHVYDDVEGSDVFPRLLGRASTYHNGTVGHVVQLNHWTPYSPYVQNIAQTWHCRLL